MKLIPCTSLLVASLLATQCVAQAETTVNLNASDASGTSSFNSAGSWNPAVVPQTGYAYQLTTGTSLALRMPSDASGGAGREHGSQSLVAAATLPGNEPLMFLTMAGNL